MAAKRVYIITNNGVKLRAAREAFGEYGIRLLQIKKGYPEIQAESSLEIARFTACYVAKSLNAPTIREHHSLYINALGIPGPYTAFIDKRLSASKLLKILSLFKDRGGFFEVSAVYAEPNGKTLERTYRVPVEFSKTRRGDSRYGWNCIILPRGGNRTFAEISEQKLSESFTKNFVWLAKRISLLP